jgi:hypothetical protein
MIPAGTTVTVRTIDKIESENAQVGQTFKADLGAPIFVGNDTVAAKGAQVFLRLAHVESAGTLKGQSKVELELDHIVIGGKTYTLASDVVHKEAQSQTTQTATRTGIGAGVGAIIGAIAGGKKGAAIGAGVGGGAGVAIEATGKGPQVHIDPESRLDFRLQQPLEVTIDAKSSTSSSSSSFRDSTSAPRLVEPPDRATDNDTSDPQDRQSRRPARGGVRRPGTTR